MVFCRQCQKRVEDCEHCVFPIRAPRVAVTDSKVATLAYNAADRVLEITFKSGQIWQLSHVPEGIYKELCDATISSFLKFIAQRYQAAPVKTGIHGIKVPTQEPCPKCETPMTLEHRTDNTIEHSVRIRWRCSACERNEWKTYGTLTTPRASTVHHRR
jgi:hypothetical protein